MFERFVTKAHLYRSGSNTERDFWRIPSSLHCLARAIYVSFPHVKTTVVSLQVEFSKDCAKVQTGLH